MNHTFERIVWDYDAIITATVDKVPPCSFCTKEAHYDAQQKDHGSWAFFCDEHWNTASVGMLGTGIGQRLVLQP